MYLNEDNFREDKDKIVLKKQRQNQTKYTKCKYSSLVIYESIWILTAQTDYIYVPKWRKNILLGTYICT